MGDYLTDAITPRWKQDPASLWKLIKAGLAVSGITPQEHDAQDGAAAAGHDCQSKRLFVTWATRALSVRKWQFMLLRKLTAFYAPYRENTKFHMLKTC